MSMRRCTGKTLIKAALLVATVVFVQSVHAQNISGKQQQAEDIPSTSQALAGRLFFSREQRERLDRARAGGGIVVETGVVDPPVSRINGFVKRSDGETAVWVDGKARYNVVSENVARLQPQDVGGMPGKVKILSGNTGSSSSLEIGYDKKRENISSKAKNKHKKKSNSTPADHRR